MCAGFAGKFVATNWRRDGVLKHTLPLNLFARLGFTGHHWKTAWHLRGLSGLAGAAFFLKEMHNLIENHRNQNYSAHDDEIPIVIRPPDAADAVGVGVADLKNCKAILD